MSQGTCSYCGVFARDPCVQRKEAKDCPNASHETRGMILTQTLNSGEVADYLDAMAARSDFKDRGCLEHASKIIRRRSY